MELLVRHPIIHAKSLQRTSRSGPRFNIKISSYQYRKSHCGDKTVARSSYLHNRISYTGKTTSLYWIKAQVPIPEDEIYMHLIFKYVAANTEINDMVSIQ